MDLIIKVGNGDICFDIHGKDTIAGLKDRIKAQLKDKYIGKKINMIVGGYLEDDPEDCGYRYTFDEDSLKEFVVRMIDEVNISEEDIEKESSDITKQVGEKMAEWSEFLKF